MALDIEECLKVVLSESTGMNDLIGQRFYPVNLPESPSYPALTYTTISGDEHHRFDVGFPRYQFSCWANKYSEAKAIANEVKRMFQRRNEPIGGTSGCRIIQGVFEGEVDLWDFNISKYHIPVDFKIIYFIST